MASLTASYWREASRPLVSLVFVIPMLIAYEAGVLLLGPSALRNGADQWLRHALDSAGFGQYFLLPILTCAILLGWHHVRREQWTFRWTVCSAMALESTIYGLALILIAQMHGSIFAALPTWMCQLPGAQGGWFEGIEPARLVAYFGAGIYEEMLFRLMLLPLVAWLLRACTVSRKHSLIGAIVITSILFSAAHYQFDFHLAGVQFASAYGDVFDWYSFLFRCSAGLFFGTLFVLRGFGIAAGSHALYDILVVLL